MQIWKDWKKKVDKERGALVIEAAFVYPIMFFILMFLLYMGNMYYLKAKISSVVSQEALTYAAKFADPNYETFQEKIPTTAGGNTQVTSELYRYLDVFNLSDYGIASDSEKSELVEQIEDTGFFSGMTPADITVEAHRTHNYIIYQTYEVTVNYKLRFPIRFIFQKEPILLDMTAHEETPIVDTAEFIRNIDMAIDFVETTKTGESIGEKLQTAYSRIDNFINGEKRDPEEAVAGAVGGKQLGDQYQTGKNGRIELKPNNSYESNQYYYETDAQGRIVSASGTLRLETAERNESAQRVAGREDRQEGDDGGHLIASRFGGSGNLDNLVPMSSNINRKSKEENKGTWYDMEEEWAKQLEAGVKVDVSITVIYEGESQRPTLFYVTYYYDGKSQDIKGIPNN